MKRYGIDYDAFAPELETYAVEIDGHPETRKENLPGREAALRTISLFRHKYPGLFKEKTPTMRMWITRGVPF